MMNMIKFSLLVLLVLVSLSACALFQDEKKTEVVEAPKPVVEVKAEPVKPPPVSREVGSIWSESSKWNELFTEASTRSMGDVVFIKPSDQFKALLSGRPDRITQSASDYVNAAARESTQIVVRIKEVLPHGIYNIEGDQTLKIRGRVQKVSLSGKIRERDISTEDTAPSEAIFDMNLEVNGVEADGDHTSNSGDSDTGPNAKSDKTKDKAKEGDQGTKVSSASK